MAKAQSPSGGPFDLDRLKELVELMEQHDLTEVSLKRGDEKWSLRRGPLTQPAMLPPAAMPVAPQTTAAGETAKPAEPADAERFLYITSPTVGTFYAAASPEDPPFVSVGSKIEPDTTVCIVEAMKVFNQIPAECSGTIVEVLVENGDPVEFGQKLFKVRPA